MMSANPVAYPDAASRLLACVRAAMCLNHYSSSTAQLGPCGAQFYCHGRLVMAKLANGEEWTPLVGENTIFQIKIGT